LSDLPQTPPRPAPVLGEHTDEVLAEILGLSALEIGKLHDSGIVAGPNRSTSRQDRSERCAPHESAR